MEPAPRTSAPRGFYILNALRVCSVISLVLSIIAAVAVVIESFDDSVNVRPIPSPPDKSQADQGISKSTSSSMR